MIARLLAQPQGFDLFQAIHLLERAQPGSSPLGRGDGTGEAVRLKGHVALAFDPSDVRSIDAPASAGDSPQHPAYTLSTAVMTLAGANGPLPMAFTEMVLGRRAARETAMADLLDIFNHRFLSFLYRSRQKHAPGLQGGAPDDAALIACLDALGNLGVTGDDRATAPRGPRGERLWLRHAGLLGGAPRSMSGLLALLTDRLGVEVRGAQFVGGWRTVDAADTLRLTRAGTRAPRLGGVAVLGRRVWDQAAGLRLEFFGLSDTLFDALLPGGDAHVLAAWLVRCYLQQDHVVTFVLHRSRPVSACALGGAGAARLGWTSWIGGRGNPQSAHDAPVAPVARSMRPARPVSVTMRAPRDDAAESAPGTVATQPSQAEGH
ncbi:type VI secretion system baseplate subunit TssG [Paraburkholderia sp.]|uniref:type VI secretion system baseplate subunit TssG n=1 Tax=Paraburkholderia sp. TaxID=1926495 RepID=UPI00344528CA